MVGEEIEQNKTKKHSLHRLPIIVYRDILLYPGPSLKSRHGTTHNHGMCIYYLSSPCRGECVAGEVHNPRLGGARWTSSQKLWQWHLWTPHSTFPSSLLLWAHRHNFLPVHHDLPLRLQQCLLKPGFRLWVKQPNRSKQLFLKCVSILVSFPDVSGA